MIISSQILFKLTSELHVFMTIFFALWVKTPYGGASVLYVNVCSRPPCQQVHCYIQAGETENCSLLVQVDKRISIFFPAMTEQVPKRS